jgi:hypothetical protein
MGITRPTGEQLRFRSQNTGDHVLDTYLEASEKGGRALTDLLDDLFDSSGTFRAANFEFQFDPSVDKIQFRAGNFASPSAGWTDITTFFNITGTFNAATTYQNFDLATTSDKDVYIVHGLSSGSTFANEAAFIASSNTTRIVDVSEARDWAKKTDGIVSSTDYSSKAWAIGGTGVTNSATGGAAKEWAIKTSGTVDGTNYSAKYWATSTDVVTVSTNIADVTTVATDISNVNTVSTNISSVNTTSSNIADVNTVAAEIGVGQDVTVVAADLSGTDTIGTAATNIANINTTAGSIANVNTVATDISNVNTVSGSIANVNTVAPYVGAGNDITVVAAQITNNNLQTIAADIAAVITTANDLNEAVSEIDTVANAIANVDTVGTNIASVNTVSTNIANVNTVGTDISNVNTVAANLGAGNDVTVVAANIADVNTVAGISADVTTAATNSVAFNNTYLGAQATAPTLDPDGSALDLGDLYFDTTTSTMKVYSASGWINAGSSVNGTADRFTYTATAAQTTFTGNDDNSNSLAYDAGFLDVYMNGVKLVNGSDFTATNGTSIVLASGAAANDTIEIIAYGTFVLADHLTETQSDAKYVEVAGDTMTGNLGIGISPVTHNGNAKTLHVDGGANASELRLTNTTTGSASANGFHIAQVGNTSYVVQNENAPLNFYTNGAYAAQFDASGNFLVGKQSNGLANDGLELSSTGYIGASISNDVAAYFNRRGNAGDVVSIMDDQVQVGALSTGSGGYMAIRGGNNTFGSGLLFGNVSIKPTSASGVVSDGAVDLGDSGAHWKDLYLSGSAKLGVTGATPAWVGATSTVVADNLFGFQGASYSNACYNISVDNNYTYFLHNAYYGSGGWTQRLTGYNPTKLQAGTDGFLFDRAASTGSDTAISWTALAAFKADTAVFNEGGNDIDFRIESAGASHMFFVDASSGYVGINQSSPQAMLDIKGNTTTYTGMSKIYLTDVSGNPSSRNWAIGNGGSGYGNFTIGVSNVATGDPMANGTHKTPFIIQPSGSVLINDDSNDADFRVETDNNSYGLWVDGSNDRVCIGHSSTGLFTASARFEVDATTNSRTAGITAKSSALSLGLWRTTDGQIIGFAHGTNGTSSGGVDVTSTGVTYNTTSDRRLKDNIEPIADGTEKLMAMKPVTHTWKADPNTGETVHGFIAQEMQEIVPEAVSGDPDGEEMMSMDYGRITPVLVAALQDAVKEITALKERVAELEAK